jgi:hypothetical protein
MAGGTGFEPVTPSSLPISLVRRLAPTDNIVRALSWLGFGRKPTKLSLPAQVFPPNYVLHFECYNHNAKIFVLDSWSGNIYVEALM